MKTAILAVALALAVALGLVITVVGTRPYKPEPWGSDIVCTAPAAECVPAGPAHMAVIEKQAAIVFTAAPLTIIAVTFSTIGLVNLWRRSVVRHKRGHRTGSRLQA
jgi:hypothetical protein